MAFVKNISLLLSLNSPDYAINISMKVRAESAPATGRHFKASLDTLGASRYTKFSYLF